MNTGSLLDDTGVQRSTLYANGPFSFAHLLAGIRRRHNDAVDVVEEGCYRRLLNHRGRALLLTACAHQSDPHSVRLEVRSSDGGVDGADLSFAEMALRRIAWLDHSPQPFYDHVRDDAALAPLIQTHHGMRPVGSPDIFEMLVIAILGQQISLIAASAIKRRMVQSLGTAATFGERTYRAFPTPEALAEASHDHLVSLAFSRRKAEYVRDLALAIAGGALNLEALRGLPHHAILERLIALRGIGRWTAEYVLLRGFAYPDALPAGDAGLRRQITRIYNLPTPPTEDEIIARAEPWRPYRSWATLYLWNAGMDIASVEQPG
jgi:DNA-3-methyladenine glycosylase II